jgi:hypothetical protein
MARARKPPRFRSKAGATVSGTFNAHQAVPRSAAFAAHASKALTVARAKNVKAYPAVAKAAAFKSALPSAPAAWTAKKRKVAKYRAAKPKGL